jgi:hypothetical protein
MMITPGWNIKPLEWLVIGFFCIVFLFIGTCTYMVVYPYKILEPISLSIDTPTVVAGGDIPYTFVYSKYLPIPARVLKRLENHVTTTYQDSRLYKQDRYGSAAEVESNDQYPNQALQGVREQQ